MAAETINNEVIFTYARMNPPHLGHLRMINFMIEKAKELNINEVCIYLSLTYDEKKNPLFCDEKMDLLQHLINKHILIKNDSVYLNNRYNNKNNHYNNYENKIKISIRCERSPYGVIYKLFEKFDKIHMVVGSDRLESMQKLIKSILSKLNRNSNSYTINSLNRGNNKNNKNISLSATKIRKSVTNNNKLTFNRLYGIKNKNNKNNNLNNLYKKLKNRLQTKKRNRNNANINHKKQRKTKKK